MTEKIKILEIGVKRVAEDSKFLSFVLNRYLEIENMSQSELILELNCSLEDLFRLALCQVPDTLREDYIERLEQISEYTCVAVPKINKIIKRVDAVVKLCSLESRMTFLMAARDKGSSKE